MSKLRHAIAALYRELGTRGLNVGASGNVSARTKHGMLITPSGITGDQVAPKSLVDMSLDGTHKGPIVPSSEWAMHAAIYQQDPTAGVIVHTHSDAATQTSCALRPSAISLATVARWLYPDRLCTLGIEG